MPHRLEIALRPELFDAEGDGIRRKAKDYFGLEIHSIRSIQVITIDADLSVDQLKTIQTQIFTNPVTQISSYDPLNIEFDWTIWVGFRPGVRDNPGSTAVEAVEDILDLKFAPDQAIYTSKQYCLKGKGLDLKDVKTIAGELLANDIIQQWKIFSIDEWDPPFPFTAI
jgi:phosphoribosylformylglycinamidine (FGAM) synthase PurS component